MVYSLQKIQVKLVHRRLVFHLSGTTIALLLGLVEFASNMSSVAIQDWTVADFAGVVEDLVMELVPVLSEEGWNKFDPLTVVDIRDYSEIGVEARFVRSLALKSRGS